MNKMQHYLLDTNIIIYIAQGNKSYIDFFEKLPSASMAISVLTYMEALANVPNITERMYIEQFLSLADIIPLDQSITKRAVPVLQTRTKKSVRDPKFTDIIIGCTALELGIPLITANPKDFTWCKGLQVVVPD